MVAGISVIWVDRKNHREASCQSGTRHQQPGKQRPGGVAPQLGDRTQPDRFAGAASISFFESRAVTAGDRPGLVATLPRTRKDQIRA